MTARGILSLRFDFRRTAFVVSCAWCERVRDWNGAWHHPHEVPPDAMPHTHGICPDCSAELLQHGREWRNQIPSSP